MLFERQRLLLTLLDAVGEPVEHTDFQMLLCLYTQECEATPNLNRRDVMNAEILACWPCTAHGPTCSRAAKIFQCLHAARLMSFSVSA